MRFKDSIKSLSILGTSQILVLILNVVFYYAFAYILGPEKYGNLAYLISIATIVATFTMFGLSQTVITFVAKKERDLVKNANLITFASSIISSLLLIFVNPFVALLSFSFSSFMMQVGNYLGQRKYKVVSIIPVGRSTIWIVVGISLYFLIGIPGILIGMAIGNVVFSFNYLKSIKFRDSNINKLRTKLKTIFHNFGVDASQTLPNHIDKLVIVPLFGFQTTGIFHFVIQFLIAIELLTLVLHRFLLAEQSGEKISKRFIYLASLASSIIILAGIFLSPMIIENIFLEYLESIAAVQLIVFGTIPLLVVAILNAKLQVLESHLVGYGVIVRIGVNLALIPVLGGFMGVIGLVLANLISIVLLVFYLLIIYYKIRNTGNLSEAELS